MTSPPIVSSAACAPPQTLDNLALVPDECSDDECADDEYSIVIEPAAPPLAGELRALWNYRELLGFLVWRELKTRYLQTVLGAAWVILQPLSMMLIFTVFFGKWGKLPTDNIPAPLFSYSGLLLWFFFSNAVGSASASLVSNTSLVTKVYFPRLILPLAATGARLVDFLVALSALGALMLWYRTPLSPHVFLAPVVVALTGVLALGLGLRLAAWNVKYRDVGHILPMLLQLLMFASPIIYSARLVPEKWRWIYAANPLVGLLNNFRAALFGLPFDWRALAISSCVAFALFLVSFAAFRKMEDSFADVI